MTSSLINTLANIQKLITICAYPPWLVFGITGCLCNLIVFSRPRLRTTSCSIYFFAASVDHLATLIVGIGPVLYAFNNPDPQTQSIFFCKIRGYIFQICLMLSRWYVAFACIDRFTSTSEQLNLRNFAKAKTAYRIIIAVIIFWSIICSHRLIFYQIKDTFCGIVNNVPAALYHSLYVIIGGGILPATIMIVCAFLIRRNLIHKREMREHMSTKDKDRLQSRIDHQVHRILFVQVICYIIFTIPQLCNLAFNAISIMDANRSSEHIAIETFVAFLAELMLYLFPVTSFYLYTLTSRAFRKELFQFFRYWICRNRQVFPFVSDFQNSIHFTHRRHLSNTHHLEFHSNHTCTYK